LLVYDKSSSVGLCLQDYKRNGYDLCRLGQLHTQTGDSFRPVILLAQPSTLNAVYTATSRNMMIWRW